MTNTQKAHGYTTLAEGETAFDRHNGRIFQQQMTAGGLLLTVFPLFMSIGLALLKIGSVIGILPIFIAVVLPAFIIVSMSKFAGDELDALYETPES